MAIVNPSTLVIPDFFIASAQSVLTGMGCGQIEVGELEHYTQFRTQFELSGIIGFSGKVKATIVISMERDVAFAATETFLGDRPNTINADVLDVVGELANMIGGGARDRMNDRQVILGLPTSISGLGHIISFEAGLEITHIPIQTSAGKMSVDFASRTE